MQTIDLNEIELSKGTRDYLFQNPAAVALYEYSRLTNDKGEQGRCGHFLGLARLASSRWTDDSL